MVRRLVDARKEFPIESFDHHDPLRMDNCELGRMLGRIAGQRRDAMPGLCEREQPSRRGRPVFTDESKGGRPVEPQLGKCLARLADEGVQLPISHDFSDAGEGRLGGIAKDSIEQPGRHLERGEVTDRAGRNGGVAD